MGQVDFDSFQKLDLRVGKIKEVYPIEGSKKLLRVIIDLGDSQRQAIAGISKYYSLQDLVGKRVIVVTNLIPKPILGYVSEVMLLAAFNDEDLSLLTTDKDMPAGTKIS
jgi:methionine--tRNA ligase beta chain